MAAGAAPQSVRAPACFWEAWREPIPPAQRGTRASSATIWAIHNACTRKDTRFPSTVRLEAVVIGAATHTQTCAPLISLIRLAPLPEMREEVHYCHLHHRAFHRRLHPDNPLPEPFAGVRVPRKDNATLSSAKVFCTVQSKPTLPNPTLSPATAIGLAAIDLLQHRGRNLL